MRSRAIVDLRFKSFQFAPDSPLEPSVPPYGGVGLSGQNSNATRRQGWARTCRPWSGTKGSNPLSSTGESDANLTSPFAIGCRVRFLPGAVMVVPSLRGRSKRRMTHRAEMIIATSTGTASNDTVVRRTGVKRSPSRRRLLAALVIGGRALIKQSYGNSISRGGARPLSMTKPIVSVAAMMLVEEVKLDPLKPVGDLSSTAKLRRGYGGMA